MSRYWERAANRADMESTNIKQEAQGSKERIQQRAEERADQMRSSGDEPGARASGDLT
jgi:hypothetical protein